jgi:hypothetical protein
LDFGVVLFHLNLGDNPYRPNRPLEKLEMKHLVMFFCLSQLLLPHIRISAQTAKVSSDESSAVRATVTNYIEAYYGGDASRMQQTLHPHYLKHVIHGNIPMREMTGSEMVAAVRNGPPDIPKLERTEQVNVLDVSGSIASAKLVVPGWVDYVTLSKDDGGWKILSVVQKIEN